MNPSGAYKLNIYSIIFLICFISGASTYADSVYLDEYKIVGIDVSRYQGKVDFKKVKASGISYVFIRATDGVTYKDPDYKTNYMSAKANGLTIGVYHFYETNDDPGEQLDNFVSTVTLSSGDLPPVIDIENYTNSTIVN